MNKQQYNQAQLAIADYNLTQVLRFVMDDGDWWGRVEPGKTKIEMTVGQTNHSSRDRTYRLGGPIPTNDPTGEFGLWWGVMTRELTDDQILSDLVDPGSRLKLVAQVEAFQGVLDPERAVFNYLMVEDPVNHDWGVGIAYPRTDDVWLVLWRGDNVLHTEPMVEFPPDMRQAIPVVQAMFINCHELTERGAEEMAIHLKEDDDVTIK